MIIRKTVLLLFVSATMPAFAQSQLDAELAALRTYCKADIERLCPDPNENQSNRIGTH